MANAIAHHLVVDRLGTRHGVLAGVAPGVFALGNRDLRDLIVVASTEVNTDEDRAAFATALTEVLT